MITICIFVKYIHFVLVNYFFMLIPEVNFISKYSPKHQIVMRIEKSYLGSQSSSFWNYFPKTLQNVMVLEDKKTHFLHFISQKCNLNISYSIEIYSRKSEDTLCLYFSYLIQITISYMYASIYS